MKNNSFRNRMMARMAEMMASCNEASYLASKSMDTKLSFREKLNLRMHLLTCKICLRYAKDLKAFDRYLKNDIHEHSHHHLLPEEKERINKRILEESR